MVMLLSVHKMNKFPKSEIVAQTWVRLYANPFQGKIFWEIETRAKIFYISTIPWCLPELGINLLSLIGSKEMRSI